MISERDIAEKFSVIWKQNFPLLTPNFIRVFNESRIVSINTQPITIDEEIKYDLVSEAAFNLSDIIINYKITKNDILSDNKKVLSLIEQTAKTIWKTGNYSRKDLELSDKEIKYILKISDNIIEFIDKTKVGRVQFRPKLKGYGFIPDLEADLTIDDTLFEVKTVTRNFKSSDLKQLFIYLALKQVSGALNWEYAGLYNPRKGTYCKFNVKSLIYNLTGGNTPNEAFEKLLDGLVRDIEIDSKF
jgi:hypothetical protein